MKKAFLCQRSTGMLFDIYNEGRTLFFDSPASQALCAAKPWRRGDSFAPSKCNRRRVSAQRARTQQKSHDPWVVALLLVDDNGFEPLTLRTSSGCSSQLS